MNHTIQCSSVRFNNLVYFSNRSLILFQSLFFYRISIFWLSSLFRFFLSRKVYNKLLLILLVLTSYRSQAITTKTSNPIHGNAPYLTFDGGQTRVTDTDGLLWISLSDGTKYTPTTNNSSPSTPIELPEDYQRFTDIDMMVPTDTNEIGLNVLIGQPFNYWGDDDGDGQDPSGVIVTGSLNLTIVDKNNQTVARNDMLTVCKSPYKLVLSSTQGSLTTLYGIPKSSSFTPSNVTYYINSKPTPSVCFAKPSLTNGRERYAGPASIWDPDKGFLTQSVLPSSYGLNFPTVGANNLYFDLDIINSGPLSWAPVSPNGDIKATMTPNASGTSVRVLLEGPVATPLQWSSINSSNLGSIGHPTLPQTFELVGRDSLGNEVVKYGFVLKQWIINRGNNYYNYSNASSWCTNIGYRMPKVQDLTNASCQGVASGSHCQGAVGATPSAPNNYYQRRIGSGFFAEWGYTFIYIGANFGSGYDYWTSDETGSNHFVVNSNGGDVYQNGATDNRHGLCIYP